MPPVNVCEQILEEGVVLEVSVLREAFLPVQHVCVSHSWSILQDVSNMDGNGLLGTASRLCLDADHFSDYSGDEVREMTVVSIPLYLKVQRKTFPQSRRDCATIHRDYPILV